MPEQTENKQTHTHSDGTTHSHADGEVGHQHPNDGEHAAGALESRTHEHEHTHSDGTTHTHEHKHIVVV
jgi:hypothetical protein